MLWPLERISSIKRSDIWTWSLYFPRVTFSLALFATFTIMIVLLVAGSHAAIVTRSVVYDVYLNLLMSCRSFFDLSDRGYMILQILFQGLSAIITAYCAIMWSFLAVRTSSNLFDWWTKDDRSLFRSFHTLLRERLEYSQIMEWCIEDMKRRPEKVLLLTKSELGDDCGKVVCEFVGYI